MLTKDTETTQTVTDRHVLALPATANITALKFVDDTSFLVLLILGKQYQLLRIPIDASIQGLVDTIEDVGNEEALKAYVIHRFNTKAHFVPVELIVGSKKGGQNVTVVAEDYRQWKIFDLEGAGAEQGAGEGAVGYIDSSDDDDVEEEGSMLVG